MIEIERALRAVELVLAGGCATHELASLSGGGPYRAGEAPPAVEEITVRGAEASQERAAIRCCLTSIAKLVAVTQLLMAEPARRSPEERAERLCRLVDDIRDGARSAYRGALILLGQEACSA